MDFTNISCDCDSPVKKIKKKGLNSLAIALESKYDLHKLDTSRYDKNRLDNRHKEHLESSYDRFQGVSESSEIDSDVDDINDVDESRLLERAGNHENDYNTADDEPTKYAELGNDSGHYGSTASEATALLDGSSEEEHSESHEINTDADISVDDGALVSTKANSHSSRSSSPISNPGTEKLGVTSVQKEMSFVNTDPSVAQRREFFNSRMKSVKKELKKLQMILNTANINLLPDKGEKLRRSVKEYKNLLVKLTIEINKTNSISKVKISRSKSKTILAKVTTPRPTLQPSPKSKSKPDSTALKTSPVPPHPLPPSSKSMSKSDTSALKTSPVVPPPLQTSSKSKSDSTALKSSPVPLPSWKDLPPPEPEGTKPLGKKALEIQEKIQNLTEERLKDLHGSLNARPSEDERAKDPKGLKVVLMPHQQHALAWLLWRESQRPRGGILADDMGLGKTLTMISLVLATASSQDPEYNVDSDDDEPVYRRKSLHHKGGTLVVCPASIISQWEAEINRRVKGGLIAVELFHGISRETVSRRLAKNDVVITTYNLVSREYNKGDNGSVLYDIIWNRVILDEAHIIRNRRSQCSEAVCSLKARNRWALTGTPIQNKELDLFALLKFLKCSPFDDLSVWRRWVDNKNAHGHQRLATVMKTLMLRRTKLELQAKGGLRALPGKNLEEIHIKLDPEEQLVYEKVLVYSRTLFAQFLHQRAEKQHMNELHAGRYDAPTFLQKPRDTQFTKVQNQLLARHADIKAHEILVLLLRLRQICCHPPLIEAMLDQEDLKGNDVVDEGGLNPDLTSGLQALNLEDDENIDPNEIGVDRRVVQDLLTSQNPVFNPRRLSSKMRSILKTIQEILDTGDKIVIVSQWTSMLEVVRSNLRSLRGATYDMLTGNVPVKNRQKIMESFNKVGSAPRILLLSLTAGGVGLNLVGGNHLLLLDIHWNPQLEAQAQDRVYRVGQKKSVHIYKFICLDTIEQRIKALQDSKLAIAQGVLTGAGTAGASKLTLDDLKSLFSL